MKVITVPQHINSRRVMYGVAVAILVFVVFGSVAALWETSFFTRMTKAGGWEIGLLGILAVLSGVYVMVRHPFCSNKSVTIGGVIGFIGVACPICNKILFFIFGGELLLTYFEPIRLYVTMIGIIIATWAVVRELQHQEEAVANEHHRLEEGRS